jgi:predicted DNA-binding transcriptional regulator AlpA
MLPTSPTDRLATMNAVHLKRCLALDAIREGRAVRDADRLFEDDHPEEPTADPPAEPVDAFSIEIPPDSGPVGVDSLIGRLEAILTRLETALVRLERPPAPRAALRRSEVAESVGISERSLERLLADGRFPKADAYLNRLPLWKVESVAKWLDAGGAPEAETTDPVSDPDPTS